MPKNIYQVDKHDDIIPSCAMHDIVSSVHSQTNEKDSEDDLYPHNAIDDVGIVCSHDPREIGPFVEHAIAVDEWKKESTIENQHRRTILFFKYYFREGGKRHTSTIWIDRECALHRVEPTTGIVYGCFSSRI